MMAATAGPVRLRLRADVAQGQPHGQRQPSADPPGQPDQAGRAAGEAQLGDGGEEQDGVELVAAQPSGPAGPGARAACRRRPWRAASPTRVRLVRTTPRRPLSEATTGARAAPRAGSQAEASAVTMPTAKAPTSSIQPRVQSGVLVAGQVLRLGQQRPRGDQPEAEPSDTGDRAEHDRAAEHDAADLAGVSSRRGQQRQVTLRAPGADAEAAPAMSTASSRASPVTRTVRPVLICDCLEETGWCAGCSRLSRVTASALLLARPGGHVEPGRQRDQGAGRAVRGAARGQRSGREQDPVDRRGRGAGQRCRRR